jgi:hypothetical protein
MIIGTDMKKKPYIAQFSEYDLSIQAQPVKNADTNERSHHKTSKNTNIFLFFFIRPVTRRITEDNKNSKKIGIIITFFYFYVV